MNDSNIGLLAVLVFPFVQCLSFEHEFTLIPHSQSSIPVAGVNALPLPVGDSDSGVLRCSGGWDAMELIVLTRLPISCQSCCSVLQGCSGQTG